MFRLQKLVVLSVFAALVSVVFCSQSLAASASTELKSSGAGAPCCTVPTAICKDPRCISYCHHRSRCCFDPCKTTPLVLQVPDNCCCCLVEVPVCIPACCEGAPSVCCHRGIFGRQVVEYSWCCGFHLKVVFDRCGDVTVHYYGV